MLVNLAIDLPKIDLGPFVLGGAAGPTGQTLREFIAAVDPKFRFYRHVERLIDVLQRVADGAVRRLMVFMPPRHGKSQTVSRLFTAYYLRRYPERWVGINSYGADLAYTLSRNARDNYTAAGGELNPKATGVTHWETPQRGGMWAAGVGGPITGKGFSLGIIDDPLKNAEEAASETIRQKHKDWYRSTFYTREAPEGAIVVIQTRWHEDDLSGWLLQEELAEDDEPERWHIVSMPAIAEEPATFPATCTVEPDDRVPGEPLCAERYPASRLQRIYRRVGPRFWNALYQQRPAPLQGDFFRRDWFRMVNALAAGSTLVRYWDKAGSAGKGDYTAGVLMARTPEGRFVVVDAERGQWSAGERERIIRQTAELDRERFGHVEIWAEQEPGSGGKESAEATIRNLAGFAAHAEPVTGDKTTRAAPLAAQAEVGNVDILVGPWNAAYLAELASFPHGRHDDQVDASSGAFAKLALGVGAVMRQGAVMGRAGARPALAQAVRREHGR